MLISIAIWGGGWCDFGLELPLCNTTSNNCMAFKGARERERDYIYIYIIYFYFFNIFILALLNCIALPRLWYGEVVKNCIHLFLRGISVLLDNLMPYNIMVGQTEMC